MTKKFIPGVVKTKSKAKPIAPIYTYEVDIGKARPLIVEANRVDQVGDTLSFVIEYSNYNLYVAGFAKWKSFRIMEEEKKQKKEDPLKKLLKKRKKESDLPLFSKAKPNN